MKALEANDQSSLNYGRTAPQEESAEHADLIGGPPADFDAAQSAVWTELAKLIVSADNIQPYHRLQFEMLCDAFIQYKETRRVLRAEGVCYNTSSKHMSGLKRKHPLVDVNQDLRKQVLELSGKFGISPATDNMRVVDAFEEDAAIAKYFLK
ncbi:MAG: P27 family phage terminase small subunit [Pseudomonadota bacterium]